MNRTRPNEREITMKRLLIIAAVLAVAFAGAQAAQTQHRAPAVARNSCCTGR